MVYLIIIRYHWLILLLYHVIVLRDNVIFLCELYFQSIGCDGVLGSKKTFDKCGVCGGNNTSCHIISGIYTRRSLPYGYNKVTTIPAGACNINITEMRPSGNYLGKLWHCFCMVDVLNVGAGCATNLFPRSEIALSVNWFQYYADYLFKRWCYFVDFWLK